MNAIQLGLLLQVLLFSALLAFAFIDRARFARLARERRRAFLAEHRRVVRLQADREALLRVLVPARRTLLVGPYLPEPTRAWIMGILGHLGAERAATVPELERIWQRRGFAYVDGRLNPEAYALFAATFAGDAPTPTPRRSANEGPRWVRPEHAVPGAEFSLGAPIGVPRSQRSPASCAAEPAATPSPGTSPPASPQPATPPPAAPSPTPPQRWASGSAPACKPSFPPRERACLSVDTPAG